MKISRIYTWLAGSQNDFIRQFQDNEELSKLAQSFWSRLEGNLGILLIIAIVIGAITAGLYYMWFNNKPGRHYHPWRWWIPFSVVAFVIVFVLSWLIEFVACGASLRGAIGVQVKVAIVNAIYAGLVYVIVSVIWCNGLPTNAYRLFKFTKS